MYQRRLDSCKYEWKCHVLKLVHIPLYNARAYHVDLLMYAFQASLPDSLPPPVCFSPPSDKKKQLSAKLGRRGCRGRGEAVLAIPLAVAPFKVKCIFCYKQNMNTKI